MGKKKQIELTVSQRGFSGGTFKDSYHQECSIHESSSVYPHIWLGASKDRDGNNLGEYDPVSGQKIAPYMHLSQETVKMLLPLLKHFAKHGSLPPNPTDDESEESEATS